MAEFQAKSELFLWSCSKFLSHNYFGDSILGPLKKTQLTKTQDQNSSWASRSFTFQAIFHSYHTFFMVGHVEANISETVIYIFSPVWSACMSTGRRKTLVRIFKRMIIMSIVMLNRFCFRPNVEATFKWSYKCRQSLSELS